MKVYRIEFEEQETSPPVVKKTFVASVLTLADARQQAIDAVKEDALFWITADLKDLPLGEFEVSEGEAKFVPVSKKV